MKKFVKITPEVAKERMADRRTCEYCGKKYGPKCVRDYWRFRRSICCSVKCARDLWGKPLLKVKTYENI